MLESINWVNSVDEELFLSQLGLSWTLIDVRLKDIDLPLSRQNTARPREPKLLEVIAGLKEDMKSGYPIPRVVGFKSPTGYVLTDGNQRVYTVEELINEGSLASDSPISMYLLKGDDPVLRDYATYFANCRHGGRNPLEEKYLLAIRAVEERGESVKKAARHAGVAESSVKTRIVAKEEHKELCSRGLRAIADKLSVSVLEHLRKLAGDEHAVDNLATMAATHGLGPTTIGEIAMRAKKAKNNTERHALLAAESERLRERTVQSNGSPKKECRADRAPTRGYRDRFFSLVPRVLHFLTAGRSGNGFQTFDQIGLSESDRTSAMNQAKELHRVLGMLIREATRNE